MIKYFCDRCGKEKRNANDIDGWEFTPTYSPFPPQANKNLLCSHCYDSLKNVIKEFLGL